MSCQPSRFIQRPSQPSAHLQVQTKHQSSNSISTGCYDNLIQIAEQQQRLIDANQWAIRDREIRGNHVDNAPMRLVVLKNEVLFEEREMAYLKAVEREAQETAARRAIAMRELSDLQMNYSSQEQYLRGVISKIGILQEQLDTLHCRQLTRMNAVRCQQKFLSSQIRPVPVTVSHPQLGTSSETSSGTISNSDVLRNDSSGSKSTILDDQHEADRIDSTTHHNFLHGHNGSGHGHMPVFPDSGKLESISSHFSHRLQGSLESLQTHRPKPVISSGHEKLLNYPQLPTQSSLGKSSVNVGIVEQVNRDISPSPPKDPYPTNKISEVGVSDEESEVALLDQLSGSDRKQSHRQVLANSDYTGILDDQLLSLNLVDDTKLARADQISIRPDTLRAAKRRSWALQDNAISDETELIKKILLDEQRKGRTHLLVGCNITSLFAASSKNATVSREDKSQVTQEKEKGTVNSTSTKADCASELLTKDIQLDEVSLEIEQNSEKFVEEAAKENDMEKRNEGMEVSDKISGIAVLIKPAPEKGILRVSGIKNAAKKVVFDPLALLLDAALEGEMDLVKASAAKLSDISACNDEGITALHNAICAGHYEIVRYLVDSCADVNAQDSDGWTPLHCAASCNNLPMVKLLVENGACIFAQTLSDLETPADKCEEDEDGFEGCQLYLKAAHQGAGVVNGGLMYAAYDYDKEEENELSFRAGTCLRVLEKDTEDKVWWCCETRSDDPESTREQGLVPRNYLSLYPRLSQRSPDFIMFNLPQVLKNHDSKEEEERRSNLVDVKNTTSNEEKTIVEHSVLISVS